MRGFLRSTALFLALSLSGCGCGDVNCPEGTEYDGFRCVAPDGGADGGEPMDDGGPDGGVAMDGGGEDSGVADAAMPDGCVPVAEICNGVDDDCDGMVDDGLPASFAADPVSITDDGSFFEGLGILGLEDEFFVYWAATDDRIRYAWVSSDGTVLRGPRLIDDGATIQQTQPSAALTDSGVVLTWVEDRNLRGRLVPVDGSSALPIAEIATDEAEPIEGMTAVAVAGGVIVTWRRGEIGVARAVWNATLDSERESPSTIYSFEALPPSFTPTLLPSEDDGEYAVLAIEDQRTGDTAHRAYLLRVPTVGPPASTYYAMGAAVPNPTLYGSVVHGVSRDSASNAFVTVSHDVAGGTRRIDLHRVTPRDTGSDMDVMSTPVTTEDRFFAHADLYATREVIDLAWVEVVGATSQVTLRSDVPGVGLSDPISVGSTVRADVGIARLSTEPSVGGVLYAEGPTDAYDVIFQPLGCE